MPVHFSFVEPIHFVSISSPIGTHIPQAVGAAYAMKLRGEKHVCLASFGDGGTSSLGFHSGLNFAACLEGAGRVPVPEQRLRDLVPQRGADRVGELRRQGQGLRHAGRDRRRQRPARHAQGRSRPRSRAPRRRPDVDRGENVPHGRPLDLGRSHALRAQGAGREWAKKDPVPRFERFLASRRSSGPPRRGPSWPRTARARSRPRWAKPRPRRRRLESIFSDVSDVRPTTTRATVQVPALIAPPTPRTGGLRSGRARR
jgi:hypothetical protein